MTMKIDLEKEVWINLKLYRLNAGDRADLEKIVNEYKEAGISLKPTHLLQAQLL